MFLQSKKDGGVAVSRCEIRIIKCNPNWVRGGGGGGGGMREK